MESHLFEACSHHASEVSRSYYKDYKTEASIIFKNTIGQL